MTNSNNAEMFSNLSLSAESVWDVLIASCDAKFLLKINSIISSEEQIRIISATSGCETLTSCAKLLPDVLILDEDIPGIPPKLIIECLKNDTDLNSIKIIFCYGSSKTTHKQELKEQGIEYFCKKTDIDNSFLKKKLLPLLYTTSISPRHNVTNHGQYHERRWPRTSLNIAAQVEMVMVHDPDQVEHGMAFLKDISRGGAFLSMLKLNTSLVPYEPYFVRLKIDNPQLKKWEAESMIVRFNPGGSTGIEFLNISKKDQLQIAKLFDK
ncbi:MAG: PilZ domain-containing protein [Candidatus Latescibacteria bacterium]|nr:PilZ domain-containing protein [Candidatus Latescibacterota bacterium]